MRLPVDVVIVRPIIASSAFGCLFGQRTSRPVPGATLLMHEDDECMSPLHQKAI